jgi:NADH:ubiquinone oxidoreductase subunit 6 (subunit J)
MSEFVFFVAAIITITGAIGVIALAKPFYSVLALAAHLVALAALFLLLQAEFVAFAQVIVYAGAVMVLYVFVVQYVGEEAQPLAQNPSRLATLAAFACGAALAVELFIAVLGSGLHAIHTSGAHLPAHSGFGTPESIGTLLLTKFLAPFEIASFLLLVAAVGAVVLARRRGGITEGIEDQAPRISVADLMRPRPAGTGTMAEAGGSVEVQDR